MSLEEIRNVIDICNARIDYNQALIETVGSLTTDEEIRGFYVEEIINTVGDKRLRENGLSSIQMLSSSFLKSGFINGAKGDISDYEQILSELEQDDINIFAASVMAKGFFNCESKQEALQFIRRDNDSSDKFEVYVVKEMLEKLTLCLNEQEQIFFRCISFVGKSKKQCFFSHDIFDKWLDEMLYEQKVILADKSFSLLTKTEEYRVERLTDELDEIKKWAHSLGLGKNILKESKAFEDFYNKLKIRIDALSAEVSKIEGAIPKKSDSKNKKSAKKRKNSSSKKAAPIVGNLGAKDVSADANVNYRNGAADEEAAADALETSFADLGLGSNNRKSAKGKKRDEHKQMVQDNALRKQQKEDARKEAESLRHTDRVLSMQYMGALDKEDPKSDRKVENGAEDLGSVEFVLSKDSILKSFKDLHELFDPALKTISFKFAQKLIFKLGGSLKNDNGGSHYGVIFGQRLKGYVKETVVGSIAKPHGKSGSEMSGLNLNLLKRAISKVLPADWMHMELSPAQSEFVPDVNSSMAVSANKPAFF